MQIRSIFFALLAISLFSVYSANAQTRNDVYAITNAKIVTVSGATIEKGTIVVRDGLIESVGAEVLAEPRPRARALDLEGQRPGLLADDLVGHRGDLPGRRRILHPDPDKQHHGCGGSGDGSAGQGVARPPFATGASCALILGVECAGDPRLDGVRRRRRHERRPHQLEVGALGFELLLAPRAFDEM